MTEINYLPAIKRAVLVPFTGPNTTPNRHSPVRADFDFGSKRVHLTDVAFCQLAGVTQQGADGLVTSGGVFARIGKFGEGLLTEDFYPLTMFGTKPRQEYGVWEFSKPYRLFPGERLSALVTYSAAAGGRGLERDCTVPAVQFNAVRVLDGRPLLLYDNTNTRMSGIAVMSVRLVSENLQCPADSPIDIYSCVVQPASMDTVGVTVTELMIYGPDGRKWWDDPTWSYLFDTPGFLMDLNKPEWILDPEQNFYAEFIANPGAADLQIVLRGQIEVTK
jgi:hypothetical protein